MARQVVWNGPPVKTWAEFHQRIRLAGWALLRQLDEYPDSVLVSGCQRSGTTAVTRLVNLTGGVADYAFGADSELDGALLLSGYVDRFTSGRHCFQTTYLNASFAEYHIHDAFRLVWVLREPRSVVYSMLHNWKRAALNRLFDGCGSRRLDRLRGEPSILSQWIGPPRIDKACASYVAKTEQTFGLRERLGDRMFIVDYDDLVLRPEATIRSVCEFAEVPFDPSLLGYLHTRSLRKGNALRQGEAARVDTFCTDVYQAARELRSTRERCNA